MGKIFKIYGTVFPSLIHGSVIDMEYPLREKYYRVEDDLLPRFNHKRVEIIIRELDEDESFRR